MKLQNDKNGFFAKVKDFWQNGIWCSSAFEMSGIGKFFLTFFRGVFSTFHGIVKNRIAVQASSLSYATLLATGPILAIVILFSSMFFRDKGEDFIYSKIMDAAVFVMPAMNEMIQSDGDDFKTLNTKSTSAADGTILKNTSTDADSASTAVSAQKPKINPQVMSFIGKILKGSSSAGAFGIVAMLFTCLLLCINMESSLNFIWGVRKGRNWVNRIVFYFAMIFFGSVGTMFAMTFFATSQLTAALGNIPMVSEYASWLAYLLGIVAMMCVIAFFYKYIPCARVKWSAAFGGAFVVLLLLLANNKFSFLYISYIAKQQNFYGYFAIVAVAMFSLYIFWFVILAGGQITYVIQFIDFVSEDKVWSRIGGNARAMLALAVYSAVAQSFSERNSKATIQNFCRQLKISESLGQSVVSFLEEKHLVCAVEKRGLEDDVCYKPNFEPDKITVGEFFQKVGDNDGDEQISNALVHTVDSVALVSKAYGEFLTSGVCAKSVRSVL